MKKLISITGSCYNEEGNIEELYKRCKEVLARHPQYDYEFVLADTCSTDGTRDVMRRIAAQDPNFKVIFNARNYGHIRSPFNALLNAKGDAIVPMCTDLQEPPEVIEDFIQKWEEGFKVVVGVRSSSDNGFILDVFRKLYYWLLRKIAPDEQLIPRFTGFGLYDRQFIDALKKYHEPYPYFRGLVSEIGLPRAEVPFVQEKRKHGRTKNNWFTLYDMAMTGFVNHTKLPLRLATFSGFVIAFLSFLVAIFYFSYKLCHWTSFELGLAPLVIGMFLLSGIQLIFLGVIGEYLGAVWTQVKNKPLVIEEERINF